MNQDFQLKLQAYVDGELPEREVREVETELARDGEARALVAELRHTSGALAEFEAGIKLPESREFYWSKIQRELQRVEQPAPRRMAIPLWQRILIPAGGFAALALIGLVAFRGMMHPSRGMGPAETYVADSGAVTYRDEAEGMTVVWLSYPGDNGIAEKDPDDIFD